MTVTEEDLKRVKEYLKKRISMGAVGADTPYNLALVARPTREGFPHFIRELIQATEEDFELLYDIARDGIYLRISPMEFVKLALKAPHVNEERIVYLGRLQGLSEVDVRSALRRLKASQRA